MGNDPTVEGGEEMSAHLKVLCASVVFWKASNIFFNATSFLVFLSVAFHTIPYALMNVQTSAKLSRLEKGGGRKTYALAKLGGDVVATQNMLVYLIADGWLLRHDGALPAVGRKTMRRRGGGFLTRSLFCGRDVESLPPLRSVEE